MSRKSSNVGAAMLQPGRQSQAAGNISVMPAAEMPMVLTLDQLSPNPDNPRTSRNPRYDDIKASIRSRGLDTVPKVTRDPDGEPDMYIFSDGGNTRYQILSELWQETGEDRFFRVHVLFKPWPGRLQCVIGHLAENEVRGELSFIEKAQGIHKARSIYEEQMGKTVSLRQLSELLTREGLPVHYSTVSRMEDALKYLYPWIPDLLESGLGRPQITSLLALRHDAERVWDEFCLISDTGDKSFSDVFGQCCGRFNSPELWSLEMFRDEFIGDLLQALPHPELDYDRWMMELDPKERNRRHHFGEPETVAFPAANKSVNADHALHTTGSDESEGVPLPVSSSRPEVSGGAVTPVPGNASSPSETPINEPPRHEVQPDMYGAAPVISGESGDVSGLVISELDAGLTSVREASSRTAPSDAEKVPEWMVTLVRGVCHAFGCQAYYSWRQTSAGYRRSVTFYGFSEKPEIAAYAFDVLTRQLKDATNSYLKTQSKRLKLATRRARAEQFRDGWVCGVREVISATDISSEEQQVMSHWLESRSMKTVTTRELKACRGADTARYQGYEAGQNARLHQGVSGRGPAAIGYRQD